MQNDVVFKNEFVTAFIGARQWPNNKGHVLVIPNAHFENLYDLPDDLGAEIHKAAKAVALAMKAVTDARAFPRTSTTNRRAIKTCGITICTFFRGLGTTIYT